MAKIENQIQMRISPYKWLATKGPDFFKDKIVFLPRNEQREGASIWIIS